MAFSVSKCILLVVNIPIIVLIVGIFVENLTDSRNNSSNKPLEMSDIQLIAKNKVKSAVTGEVVTYESLWEKNPVVITFFRRWGCSFCRLAAQDFSSIKEDLDAHGVRLVGIGVEDLGKEEFIKGNYFNGELYVDDDKKTYKDLNFKRYGKYSIWPALLSKSSRDAILKSYSGSISYNMEGDYYQVGGTLVISAGGEKLLLSHKQESLADHVDVNEVLKSLGIAPKKHETGEKKDTADATCNLENQEGVGSCQ